VAQRELSEMELRALDYIEQNTPLSLQQHVVGTRDLALEINRRQSLGLDEEKISLASLLHDVARLFSSDQLVFGLKAYGLDPDSFDYAVPMLLHVELGAEIAKREIGVEDEDVLNAIRLHATGSAGMSVLDKLIYVADKVEPLRDYPGVGDLREFALRDLNAAFPVVISSVLKYLIDAGHPLDYNSVTAYNESIRDLVNQKVGQKIE